MLVGLNAGFGLPLGADSAFIHSIGCTIVRQEFRFEIDDATIALLMADIAGEPLRLLALLGGGTNSKRGGSRIEPHEFAALGTRVATAAVSAGLTDALIEVGNEPDIGHADYRTRPADFTQAVVQTLAAVRRAGLEGPVISGGISNLSPRRLAYLEQMAAAGLPSDVVVGFHRYPHGLGPQVPHPGFPNRDAEWRRLTSIAARRQLACTEFGHHTARRSYRFMRVLPLRRRLSEATVAEHIVYDLTYFRDRGCLLAAVYQLNDGPTDTPSDRYGIRRADGTPKPAAAAISTFT